MQKQWIAIVAVLWIAASVPSVSSGSAIKKYDAKKESLSSQQYAAKKESIQDSHANYVPKKGISSSIGKKESVSHRATVSEIPTAKADLTGNTFLAGKVITQLQQLTGGQLDKEKKNFVLPNGDTLIINPALPTFDLQNIFGNVGAVNLANILAIVFASLAAVGAGLAALIAFIVPPLQIANQILAIIAIALLIAYIAEDKGFMEYVMDTGYGDSGYGSGTGYGDMGYGSSDTSGYSSGGSSYTDYRRSGQDLPFSAFNDLYAGQAGVAAAAPNSIDGSSASLYGAAAGARSMAPRSVVNRLAKMVRKAVEKYTNMYGDDADASKSE